MFPKLYFVQILVGPSLAHFFKSHSTVTQQWVYAALQQLVAALLCLCCFTARLSFSGILFARGGCHDCGNHNLQCPSIFLQDRDICCHKPLAFPALLMLIAPSTNALLALLGFI
jgi:hypothetical protein